MTNYAVGYNMPGYLPEAEVFVTNDYDQARRVLIDELERHADWLDEVGMHDAAEEIASDQQDLNLLSVGTEWGNVYPHSDSEHDLGLSFWLMETDEEPEDDEL